MKEFYTRYMLHNLPFHILTGIAIALLITSFFLPPTGEISPSVLQGVAEIFAFSSLYTVIHAIDKGRTVGLKHHDTEITINKEQE